MIKRNLFLYSDIIGHIRCGSGNSHHDSTEETGGGPSVPPVEENSEEGFTNFQVADSELRPADSDLDWTGQAFGKPAVTADGSLIMPAWFANIL